MLRDISSEEEIHTSATILSQNTVILWVDLKLPAISETLTKKHPGGAPWMLVTNDHSDLDPCFHFRELSSVVYNFE